MPGIFDLVTSAFQTGSAPGAQTRSPTDLASDAYNAAQLAKGMVRDPNGNWVQRASAPQAPKPTAMPSAISATTPAPTALTPKLNALNPAGYAMTVADKSEQGG
jgi:hypothetical protein